MAIILRYLPVFIHMHQVYALFYTDCQDGSCCSLVEITDICSKEAAMAEFDTEGNVVFMIWFLSNDSDILSLDYDFLFICTA